MSRDEDFQRARDCALAYTDPADAIASLTADLSGYPETDDRIVLMVIRAAGGEFEQPGRLAEFIEGFR